MNKIVTAGLLGVMALGTVACADRPSSITASYVPHSKYENLNCTQLASEFSMAVAKLSEFTGKQNTVANADAAGVFLVLIPPSALTGDYAADVAKWKGEVEAIETAQRIAGCK